MIHLIEDIIVGISIPFNPERIRKSSD